MRKSSNGIIYGIIFSGKVLGELFSIVKNFLVRDTGIKNSISKQLVHSQELVQIKCNIIFIMD